MKKTILTSILVAACTLAMAQKRRIATEPEFKTIINAPIRHSRLSELKSKIVIIEFWATWCGPCVEAMSHLMELQKKYKNKLQVIAVTDETPARARQYLKFRPSNLWFAIDTDGAIARAYPHRILPHTVLIDKDGRLVANTTPEKVSEGVIDSLWRGMTPLVSPKTDNLLGQEELARQYFFAADTVRRRFMMQTEIKGALSVSTTHFDDSVFNGRRLLCINLSLSTLYNIAYGGFPSSRVIDQTHKSDDPIYCLDLIVEEKSDMLPTLQRELLKRFDVKARIVSKPKEVYVLTVKDVKKFGAIPINRSGNRTYISSHGNIDQQGINMTEFADYLENYGTGKLPVVDETYRDQRFDIKFSFQPENPLSLTQVLDTLGLGLEKKQRNIDFLLLYEQQNASLRN